MYANTKELASELMAVANASTMSAFDLHQMETLKADNEKLRHQLNEFGRKIARVSSLEQEMAKIHQAYQSLLKHSEKREMLEKSARAKLQAVIINLSDANKVLIQYLGCFHVLLLLLTFFCGLMIFLCLDVLNCICFSSF